LPGRLGEERERKVWEKMQNTRGRFSWWLFALRFLTLRPINPGSTKNITSEKKGNGSNARAHVYIHYGIEGREGESTERGGVSVRKGDSLARERNSLFKEKGLQRTNIGVDRATPERVKRGELKKACRQARTLCKDRLQRLLYARNKSTLTVGFYRIIGKGQRGKGTLERMQKEKCKGG